MPWLSLKDVTEVMQDPVLRTQASQFINYKLQNNESFILDLFRTMFGEKELPGSMVGVLFQNEKPSKGQADATRDARGELIETQMGQMVFHLPKEVNEFAIDLYGSMPLNDHGEKGMNLKTFKLKWRKHFENTRGYRRRLLGLELDLIERDEERPESVRKIAKLILDDYELNQPRIRSACPSLEDNSDTGKQALLGYISRWTLLVSQERAKANSLNMAKALFGDRKERRIKVSELKN